MGKLIDIEKIRWNGGATCPEWISRAQLEEMETVELIRCKDCKKWDGSEAVCKWWYCKTDSCFYCGYAEPR